MCAVFFARMAISKTVWKMVKDHRYFQFAKWMKEKRAEHNTKAFSFAKMRTHTHTQFRKMLAKTESERTNYECCLLSQGDQRVCVCVPFLCTMIFFPFQFYLCGHFFTFAYTTFLLLTCIPCACYKTIRLLCRHATTSISAWLTKLGGDVFFFASPHS